MKAKELFYVMSGVPLIYYNKDTNKVYNPKELDREYWSWLLENKYVYLISPSRDDNGNYALAVALY